MLLLEHSAILSTFIKLPFVTKIFVFFSIFEWPCYTGFTVCAKYADSYHYKCPILACKQKNMADIFRTIFNKMGYHIEISQCCLNFECQSLHPPDNILRHQQDNPILSSCTSFLLIPDREYSKTCVNGHSQNDRKTVFNTIFA